MALGKVLEFSRDVDRNLVYVGKAALCLKGRFKNNVGVVVSVHKCVASGYEDKDVVILKFSSKDKLVPILATNLRRVYYDVRQASTSR